MDSATHAFPVTRWTWVNQAGQVDDAGRLAALESFLRLYYPALLAHARGQFRLAQVDAEDCVQQFILDKVIRRGLLEKADRERGRFRSFLCQSLNRFTIDRLRRDQALKRAPLQTAIPLEILSERELHGAPALSDASFDDVFFQEAIHETLRRMRRRCGETNREVLWQLFENRVLNEAFDGVKPVPYDRLVPLLQLDTSEQAANLLTTAKRLFVRTLRSVIRDYAATDAELRDEFQALERSLARAGS